MLFALPADRVCLQGFPAAYCSAGGTRRASQDDHLEIGKTLGCELPSPGTDIALPEHRHAALSVKYYTMIARSAYNKTVYNRGFAWNKVLGHPFAIFDCVCGWGYYYDHRKQQGSLRRRKLRFRLRREVLITSASE